MSVKARVIFVVSLALAAVIENSVQASVASRGQKRTTKLGSTAPIIPFRLEDDLITIGVKLDDHSYNAVLDSGTGGLLIDRAAASRARLEEHTSSVETSGGGGRSTALSAVDVHRLVVGPIELLDQGGYVGDLSHLSSSAGFPIDLLIGGPFFTGHIVKIDYVASKIEITPARRPDGCRDPIAIKLVHGVPVVDAFIKLSPKGSSIPVRLMVDLGTRHYPIMLGSEFLRLHALDAGMVLNASVKVGTGLGGEMTGTVSKVSSLKIGLMKYHNLEGAFTSSIAPVQAGLFDGMIGVPLWKLGSVTFNYSAKRVCIRAA